MKKITSSIKKVLTTRSMKVFKISFEIDCKSEGNKLRIQYHCSDDLIISFEFTELLATILMRLYNIKELKSIKLTETDYILFVFEGECDHISYPVAIYINKEVGYTSYSRVWYDTTKKTIVSFDEL